MTPLRSTLLLLVIIALLTPQVRSNVCCVQCYYVDNVTCFYCTICGCTPDGPYNSCPMCYCFSFTSIKEAFLRPHTDEETKVLNGQYK
jgi:hypothetical protein